jgi:hypothetical protein
MQILINELGLVAHPCCFNGTVWPQWGDWMNIVDIFADDSGFTDDRAIIDQDRNHSFGVER